MDLLPCRAKPDDFPFVTFLKPPPIPSWADEDESYTKPKRKIYKSLDKSAAMFNYMSAISALAETGFCQIKVNFCQRIINVFMRQ